FQQAGTANPVPPSSRTPIGSVKNEWIWAEESNSRRGKPRSKRRFYLAFTLTKLSKDRASSGPNLTEVLGRVVLEGLGEPSRLRVRVPKALKRGGGEGPLRLPSVLCSSPVNHLASMHNKVSRNLSSSRSSIRGQSQCFYIRERPRRSGQLYELIDAPMGPDTGEGGGFLRMGHRGVHTVPGVGRESNGLEFEIARSRTGDDGGSEALPVYHWNKAITSDRPLRHFEARSRPSPSFSTSVCVGRLFLCSETTVRPWSPGA
ncbi:hypothetical protein THAOC_12756, partial [Thalassiosira oceanica]